MNKDDLLDFEKEVIKEFKKGETYGPVHLSGGNEEQLLKIFKKIKSQDWVFGTHRSHYMALLKSQDKKWLMDEIIKYANSSHINSKKYKIFTSAIVGGIIPIALGVAMGIKMKQKEMEKILKETIEPMKGKNWKVVGKVKVTPMNQSHVWCFVGDSASEMGQYWECLKYAKNFELPITYIVEDNSWSCNSPTKDIWGKRTILKSPNQIIYKYQRIHNHYGIGEWVIFKKKKFKSQGDYTAYKQNE